jgi:hypothetical protein
LQKKVGHCILRSSTVCGFFLTPFMSSNFSFRHCIFCLVSYAIYDPGVTMLTFHKIYEPVDHCIYLFVLNLWFCLPLWYLQIFFKNCIFCLVFYANYAPREIKLNFTRINKTVGKWIVCISLVFGSFDIFKLFLTPLYVLFCFPSKHRPLSRLNLPLPENRKQVIIVLCVFLRFTVPVYSVSYLKTFLYAIVLFSVSVSTECFISR